MMMPMAKDTASQPQPARAAQNQTICARFLMRQVAISAVQSRRPAHPDMSGKAELTVAAVVCDMQDGAADIKTIRQNRIFARRIRVALMVMTRLAGRLLRLTSALVEVA